MTPDRTVANNGVGKARHVCAEESSWTPTLYHIHTLTQNASMPFDQSFLQGLVILDLARTSEILHQKQQATYQKVKYIT